MPQRFVRDLPHASAPAVSCLALARHPQCLSAPVRAIAASARIVDGELRLAFTLDADMTQLRIPARAQPKFTDGLWHHTCFEAFAAAHSAAGYHEFNFSPSGEWAAYAFRAYRERSEALQAFAARIALHRSADALELDAAVPLAALPHGARLQLGLSAVIEDSRGELSYWALRHAPGKPDFHQRDAFAIELVVPQPGEPGSSR